MKKRVFLIFALYFSSFASSSTLKALQAEKQEWEGMLVQSFPDPDFPKCVGEFLSELRLEHRKKCECLIECPSCKTTHGTVTAHGDGFVTVDTRPLNKKCCVISQDDKLFGQHASPAPSHHQDVDNLGPRILRSKNSKKCEIL